MSQPVSQPGRQSIPAVARLGNDIARQFAHLGRDDAVAAIAAHLDQFWEARMRAELTALIEAGDGALDPLLVAAAEPA
ncbi:MAG: formate dehydrogenase subunit delta [Nocardioides sp.]